MKNLLMATFLTPFFTTASLACSMAVLPEKPRSMVAPGMYILIGEVTGYTEPISDPENFRGVARGTRLKVVENIHVPFHQNDYVDLFMFGHGTDCFPETSGYQPPIGTRYRLALYPARHIAAMSSGHIRLESGVFDIVALDEAMFGFSTTAQSTFDYKNDLPLLVQRFKAPEMADKRRWLSDFLYVEVSKDLIRFQSARTEEARMDLLERLLYCPNIDYRTLIYCKRGDPESLIGPNQVLFTIRPSPVPQHKPRKLNKEESRLLAKRTRLENAGELNGSKWFQ